MAARAEANRVIAHARAHPYRVGISLSVPGDDPNFVVRFHRGFRAVFTFSEKDGLIFRHLSVSVPDGALPNPLAVYTIAGLFGFTGWSGKSYTPPEGWDVGVNNREHCITILQQLPPEVVH